MKSAIGKTAGKANSEAADVEAYLAKVPEPARTTLEKLRATIGAAAPKEATECLSYGIPTFRYKGGLVSYAAFKKHCSFFPMQASLIDEMKDELKRLPHVEGNPAIRRSTSRCPRCWSRRW